MWQAPVHHTLVNTSTCLTMVYYYGAFLNDNTRQLGGSLYSYVVEFVTDKNAFDK